MTGKRIWLFLLGIVGGLLAVRVLCFSVAGGLSVVNDQDTVLTAIPVVSGSQQSVRPAAFPMQVTGTTLIAERLVSYDGPFVEDGTDREVVGIAALCVYNAGSEEILSALIALYSENISYHFYAEHIPPKSAVLLLEQEAQCYQPCSLFLCTGQQVECQNKNDVMDRISLSDVGMGAVKVTNVSERSLLNLCLNYKSWLSPPDIYVGGIAYDITIPVLLPGETVCIYPYHYAGGYSKIISATADRLS